jgi:hypothetical protein
MRMMVVVVAVVVGRWWWGGGGGGGGSKHNWIHFKRIGNNIGVLQANNKIRNKYMEFI